MKKPVLLRDKHLKHNLPMKNQRIDRKIISEHFPLDGRKIPHLIEHLKLILSEAKTEDVWLEETEDGDFVAVKIRPIPKKEIDNEEETW